MPLFVKNMEAIEACIRQTRGAATDLQGAIARSRTKEAKGGVARAKAAGKASAVVAADVAVKASNADAVGSSTPKVVAKISQVLRMFVGLPQIQIVEVPAGQKVCNI